MKPTIPDFLDFAPTGRLCVRKTSGGFVAVGVLHFPRGFRPEEGSTYPIVVQDGRASVLPFVGHVLPEEQLSDGFSGWSASSNWPQFSGGFSARFVEAFRDQNGWSVLAVTRDDPFAEVLNETERDGTHYWVEVKDGAVSALSPPCKRNAPVGMAISQICTDLCVWPDRKGELHTLPVLPRSVARDFSLISKLGSMLSRETLSLSSVKELVRGTHLFELGASFNDEDYLKYLDVASQYGMIDGAQRALSEREFLRREEFSSLVASALMHDLLDDPSVLAKLRFVADRDAYPQSPRYWVTKNHAFTFEDESEDDLRWVLELASNRVVAAQYWNDHKWVDLPADRIADLQQNVLNDDFTTLDGGQANVLPYWAELPVVATPAVDPDAAPAFD